MIFRFFCVGNEFIREKDLKKIFLNFDEQKAKLTKRGSKSASVPPLSEAPEPPRLYASRSSSPPRGPEERSLPPNT